MFSAKLSAVISLLNIEQIKITYGIVDQKLLPFFKKE